MLDAEYLVYGLNGLARAHQTDYFADGHRGAAIISAFLLSREIEMGREAASLVRDALDEQWVHLPLCAPFPEEPPDLTLLAKIVTAARSNVDGLRQAGHNVIFTALALKALRLAPEAATPARVDGMCQLIKSFTTVDELRVEAGDCIPRLGPPRDTAQFILGELIKCVAIFEGRGQGWSGHLLTFGRAVMDLRDMGFTNLADEAEDAFRIYIKRIRMGPLQTDGVWPEHAARGDDPRERQYWEHRLARPLRLGHVLKYPFAYCHMVKMAADDDLKKDCEAISFHVL